MSYEIAIRDACEDEKVSIWLKSIKSLMEKMHLKIDDAFDILSIPAEYRLEIKAKVLN